MGRLRVLVHSVQLAQHIHPPADHAGDVKIEWNPKDPESLRLAKEAFNRARGKGFQGFRMSNRGRTGDPLKTFDPEAEAILMVPPIAGGVEGGREEKLERALREIADFERSAYLADDLLAMQEIAVRALRPPVPVHE